MTRPPSDNRASRRLRHAVSALGLCLAGCAHLNLDPHYAGPVPLPADVAAYYSYPNTPQQVTITPMDQGRGYHRSLVRFPLLTPDFTPTEPTVEIEWYESDEPGRRPAILFSPILGGDYPLEHGLCRFFASHGFHVALVHRKTLKVSPDQPPEHLELLLRQAILRSRQIVDWMAAQERVDPDRMGSFGISMGGIANVITAAVEPRLRCHVIALAGGSIPDILSTSHDRLLTKPRARYLAHNHIDIGTMHHRLTEAMRTDPMNFARYVDARNLLTCITLLDRTVGTPNSFRLWRALGKPEVFLIPAGHYTAYLFLPVIKYQSLRFFRKHLLPPSSSTRSCIL